MNGTDPLFVNDGRPFGFQVHPRPKSAKTPPAAEAEAEYPCGGNATARQPQPQLFSVTWSTNMTTSAVLNHPVLPRPPPQRAVDVQLPNGAHAGCIRYAAFGLPEGVQVNSTSPSLVGSPSRPGTFLYHIVATVRTGQGCGADFVPGTPADTNDTLVAVVNNEPFVLHVGDCDAQLSCNGTQCVDTIEHDGRFRCNCSDPLNPLCLAVDADADAMSATNPTRTIITTGLSSAVLVVILALAALVYRRRRRRQSVEDQPFNFDRLLERLRKAGKGPSRRW